VNERDLSCKPSWLEVETPFKEKINQFFHLLSKTCHNPKTHKVGYHIMAEGWKGEI